jgi:hypothetical protein
MRVKRTVRLHASLPAYTTTTRADLCRSCAARGTSAVSMEQQLPHPGAQPTGASEQPAPEQQQQQQQASTTSSNAEQLRARVHCFSHQAPDAAVHFQILDLGQQLYIWMGVGDTPRLQNMYLAIQARHVSATCGVCCSVGRRQPGGCHHGGVGRRVSRACATGSSPWCARTHARMRIHRTHPKARRAHCITHASCSAHPRVRSSPRRRWPPSCPTRPPQPQPAFHSG